MAARDGFKSAVFRTKSDESTNEPPRYISFPCMHHLTSEIEDVRRDAGETEKQRGRRTDKQRERERKKKGREIRDLIPGLGEGMKSWICFLGGRVETCV